MKRVLTTIILAYWLVFFGLHTLGALAGTLNGATLSGISGALAILSADGAIRAMPLVSAGMGSASLVVATLFLWAILSGIFGHQKDDDAAEIEKIAFGGAGLVFTMLMALAIVDAQPELLLAVTSYFAALLLSWIGTRVELMNDVAAPRTNLDFVDQSSIGSKVARSMAISAAHENVLAKIAGRERN